MRWGRTWVPVADFATIDLRARDMWTADVPLVGPYSRYGWNHPGPWMFWGLGLFSRAANSQAWATLVAHAALQGLAIVWLARLTWRQGGPRLLIIALAVLGLTYGALDGGVLLEPWNPHVALPLFVVFVFQAWLLGRDDLERLPGLAVSSTLLVQVHVGYAAIVAATLLTVGAMLWLDRRRGRLDLTGWRRPVRNGLLAMGLLWIAPVIDELVRWPRGNGRLLFDQLVLGRNSEVMAGLRQGAGIVASSFRLPPAWLGGSESTDAITSAVDGASLAWWIVPLALGGVGFVAVSRTRNRDDARLLTLSTVLVLVGVAAVARVTGPLAAYIFHWRTPIAVLFTIAALAATARWVGLLDRPSRRFALGAGLAVLASLAYLGLARDIVTYPDEVRDTEDEAAALIAPLDDLGLPIGPTIVRYAGSPLPGLHAAVINELDRGGHAVRVDRGGGWQWGYGREASVGDVDEVWYVMEDGQYKDLLTELPGGRVIVDLSPLSAAEEAELERLDRQVAAELVAAGRPELVEAMGSEVFGFAVAEVEGVDQRAASRLGELNTALAANGGCRCAIVGFPAAQAPPLGIAELPPASWGAG